MCTRDVLCVVLCVVLIIELSLLEAQQTDKNNERGTGIATETRTE